MTEVVRQVPTAEDMRAFGEALGRAARPGDRFLLEGPLGAGKTTFVQGLARGLGVTTPVSSPTFVIETQYQGHGRLTLYHVDLYRLERIEPALLGDLEEHLFGDGVAAVEWAERLPPELHEGVVVRFSGDGDAERTVTLLSAEERLATAALA